MEKLKTIHWIIILFAFAFLGIGCMIIDIKSNDLGQFTQILINIGLVIGIIGGFSGALAGFIKLGE